MNIDLSKLKGVSRIHVGLALLACAWPISAQAQCNPHVDRDDYVVRNVKLKTLFGSAPAEIEAALQKHRGEKYIDNENGTVTLSQYFAEVQTFFAEKSGAVTQDRRAGINQKKSFYVRATFINGCVEKVPETECLKTPLDAGRTVPHCVDVTLKIKVLPVHTESLSANLLDIARSNRLRFYRELPAPIRVFNPSFWVDYDRDYGATAVINSTLDLMSLTPENGETAPARSTQLHLSVNARKSLQRKFYDAASTLSFSSDRPGKPMDKLGLNVSFLGNEVPHGERIKLQNSLRLGANIGFTLKRGPISNIGLVANYRHASSRLLESNGAPSERSSENAFESHGLVEGSIARGYLRGAVWFDSASTSANAQNSYRRLSVLGGYAKEFVLPRKNCRVVRTEDDQELCVFSKKNAPAIGVEMLFGSGRAWGRVPEYARFFGGNSAGNFLYDSLNEAAPIVMPNGPLIRSFGINKAGVRTNQGKISSGGTSYWHYNLSVALPLGHLSRPLIPAETVTDSPEEPGSCTGCASLKDALKNQIAGEKNIFIDALAVRGMTEEQREDLALDPDDPDNPLTDEQRARLAEAERVFDLKRQEVTPQADRLWERLTPTIAYIADHANLYAIRPLFMLDSARLTDSNIPDQRTRMALGGGIQFNVVVVKFEVGYLRTVRSMPGDQKGNFVIRMLFEKLF